MVGQYLPQTNQKKLQYITVSDVIIFTIFFGSKHSLVIFALIDWAQIPRMMLNYILIPLTVKVFGGRSLHRNILEDGNMWTKSHHVHSRVAS